jgi:hypothetical protein
MAVYMCVLLSQDGKVEAVEEISALVNWSAIRKARTICRDCWPDCPALELWLDKRLIVRALNPRRPPVRRSRQGSRYLGSAVVTQTRRIP